MDKIRIEQPNEQKLKERGIFSWPVWEKEASTFDWTYESQEVCYLLKGRVTVKAGEGSVSFGAGDLVTFPAGLKCEWTIHEDVKKHYRFGD